MDSPPCVTMYYAHAILYSASTPLCGDTISSICDGVEYSRFPLA